jgi:hypothetical protein
MVAPTKPLRVRPITILIQQFVMSRKSLRIAVGLTFAAGRLHCASTSSKGASVGAVRLTLPICNRLDFLVWVKCRRGGKAGVTAGVPR